METCSPPSWGVGIEGSSVVPCSHELLGDRQLWVFSSMGPSLCDVVDHGCHATRVHNELCQIWSVASEVGTAKLLLGWRPSLLGWRPLHYCYSHLQPPEDLRSQSTAGSLWEEHCRVESFAFHAEQSASSQLEIHPARLDIPKKTRDSPYYSSYSTLQMFVLHIFSGTFHQYHLVSTPPPISQEITPNRTCKLEGAQAR